MAFKPFANLFGSKKQKSNTPLADNQKIIIKALYVLAFSPEKMDQKTLMTVIHLADEMLKNKNATFKQRMEEWALSKTRIEASNTEYIAEFHTPAGMQTLMMGWLKNQYKVMFNPTTGDNFFLHGMRDPQGRENFILFYFDVDYTKTL